MMKRKTWLACGAALLLWLAGATSGLAQSAGTAAVAWWVIANGGSPATAGTVTLNGTAGQAIIDTSASADGNIILGAGYWPSVSANSVTPKEGYFIYIPLMQH